MKDKGSVAMAYAMLSIELSAAYKDYANDMGDLRRETNLARVEELQRALKKIEHLLKCEKT